MKKDKKPIKDFLANNVNFFNGHIVIICSYLLDLITERFLEERFPSSTVYSFCPEMSHIDKLGFKFCTALRLGKIKAITALFKDGSPHSIQIPMIIQEAAENTNFNKNNINYYSYEKGHLHKIDDNSVRKARHLSEIQLLMNFENLINLVCFLRSENGCQNEKKENLQSCIRNLNEELNEFSEAIKNHNNKEGIIEELGDLLFNLILISSILNEMNIGGIDTVIGNILKKMIARHSSIKNIKKFSHSSDALAINKIS